MVSVIMKSADTRQKISGFRTYVPKATMFSILFFTGIQRSGTMMTGITVN